MPRHTCHAEKCPTVCPPRFLRCAPHWRLVPRKIQREVYRTIELRGRLIDETWAPWWRAAHEAIAAVALREGTWTKEQADAYLEKEHAIADRLEADAEDDDAKQTVLDL